MDEAVIKYDAALDEYNICSMALVGRLFWRLSTLEFRTLELECVDAIRVLLNKKDGYVPVKKIDLLRDPVDPHSTTHDDLKAMLSLTEPWIPPKVNKFSGALLSLFPAP